MPRRRITGLDQIFSPRRVRESTRIPRALTATPGAHGFAPELPACTISRVGAEARLRARERRRLPQPRSRALALNFPSAGARLRVPDAGAVPQQCELLLKQTGEYRPAHVGWTRKTDVAFRRGIRSAEPHRLHPIEHASARGAPLVIRAGIVNVIPTSLANSVSSLFVGLSYSSFL